MFRGFRSLPWMKKCKYFASQFSTNTRNEVTSKIFPWSSPPSVNWRDSWSDYLHRTLWFYMLKPLPKEFIKGAAVAFQVATKSIFQYAQSLLLKQQEPTAVTTAKEGVQYYLDPEFSKLYLEAMDAFHEKFPSAEIVYKMEPLEITKQKDQSEPSSSSPSTLENNSNAEKKEERTDPQTEVKAKIVTSRTKTFRMSSSSKKSNIELEKYFPKLYESYTKLSKNNQDQIDIEGYQLLIFVDIECRETFYVKDRSTNEIIQGSMNPRKINHLATFRSMAVRAIIGEEKFTEVGDWNLVDIDLWSVAWVTSKIQNLIEEARKVKL